MITLALGLAFGCVSVLAFVLILLLLKKASLKSEVYRETAMLRNRIEEFKIRIKLVEPHAADYMNSLGAEGSRAVLRLRDIISALERLIQELDNLLAYNHLGTLFEAKHLLDTAFLSEEPEDKKEGFVTLSYDTLTSKWEEEIEDLLQEVGGKIANASISAEEVGIPKRRKRQPTLLSLYKADIRPKGKGKRKRR